MAKFHGTYLVICIHSCEGKIPSYSQINTVCLLKVKGLFHEQAKCVECVATSLKHAFSSLREHLQFNFNSNVFLIRWSGTSPHACMVRFVRKRGPFYANSWSVLSQPWSVLSVVRFVHGPLCP